MSKAVSLYVILFFLIFFPVLDISGHFINIVEFYIYALFFFNIKKMIPIAAVKIYIVYLVLFFISVVFTALIASKPINNYDFFILRNGAQLVCLLSILYLRIFEIFKEETPEKLKMIILRCFYILALPAFLVFAERLNLLNSRQIVKLLYKPQFFFLDANVFS
ncbi:MAG: hypothetical protein Q7U04_10805, partial [Bacteriovorax sp.]|nr:hypothetical protein [Bacteriovorax sp.]